MTRRVMQRFFSDERGSAMTEFVIGLPVYVLIFSGLGMMFRYNNEGMAARMKVIQELSTRTTAVNSWEDFVPGSGGSIATTNFGQIDFPGSGADSMLVDSARKGSLGGQFGQIKAPANPPTTDLRAIVGDPVFTNNLLSEQSQPLDPGGSWASIIRGILNLTGANVSIGAGIRYTPIEANASHTFYHPWAGTTTYNPGTVDLAAPTAATHRVFSVAVARLEMNRLNPYRSAMLEFKFGIEENEMNVTGGLPPGVNFSQADQDACQQQAQDFQNCVQDPAVEAQAASTRCGGVLGVGDHQCTTVEVCQDLGRAPDDSCTNQARDTSIFETQLCDEMGPGSARCQRPQENDRDEQYDPYDNLPGY